MTLAGFRAGTFEVLVATDVAARGLDISGVDLVVQSEPSKDPETYIHRSALPPFLPLSAMFIQLCQDKEENTATLLIWQSSILQDCGSLLLKRCPF